MDGEGGQLCGRSRKEMNRSYKCFLMDVEELEEPDEQSSRRPHQVKSPSTMCCSDDHL